MEWKPIGEWWDATDFGDLPGWVAAVLTGLALVIAAQSYARDVKRRREAQARLVYATETFNARHEPGPVRVVPPGGRVRGNADYSVDKGAAGRENLRVRETVLRVDIEIHNRSDELIGPVLFQGPTVAMPPVGWAIVSQVIEPGESVTLVFLRRPFNPAEMPPVDVTIAYRDSSGRWWRRVGTEPIEMIRDDEVRRIEHIGQHEPPGCASDA
ncbi:hypothetical protein QQX09_12190 [Demequina sp. SYSU T00192]|uniref:DUF4352 domain-containing protein n=1 Tax=Demequina litoralis TaxID=3051660 RepID=A0ABT8GCB4_9MICO|nr:hypothetical protein [Demequina sp. SYSU T00192]MDN4476617.1 hypothetical protein [Demequina sp. SYSU T00192]